MLGFRGFLYLERFEFVRTNPAILMDCGSCKLTNWIPRKPDTPVIKTFVLVMLSILLQTSSAEILS